MPIVDFTFEQERREQFVRFGYDLNMRDRGWIAPFAKELRFQMSPQFTFYQRPNNEHRCFLATAKGRVVGRVMAIRNTELHDPDGTPVGAVGFFESENDRAVVSDLLGAAVVWLRNRFGLTRVWGPVNFDIWHGYRFMTVGHDREPFYGEPRNKAYYPEMFDQCGWKIKAEWDSVEVEGRETLREMIRRGGDRYELLVERGYVFRSLDPKRWGEEVRFIHGVMTQSFDGFLGATPLPVTELARMLEKVKRLLRPEFCVLARNERGEPAGFSLALPEQGAAVQAMRGETNLPARIRYACRARRAEAVNFYLGGITPEEIARRSGLGRAGFYAVIDAVLKGGYEKLLLTLRLKGNAAHALALRGSPKPQREYALFEVKR